MASWLGLSFTVRGNHGTHLPTIARAEANRSCLRQVRSCLEVDERMRGARSQPLAASRYAYRGSCSGLDGSRTRADVIVANRRVAPRPSSPSANAAVAGDSAASIAGAAW